MKDTKTYQQKLSWLKKNKVMISKKPSPSSVNRAYSYYQRNPLNTPLYIAYGLKKRIEKKIEKNGDKAILNTPKGKITAKAYYKKKSQKSYDEIQTIISPQITFEHDIYRKNKRVNDYLTFRTSITCNRNNYYECLSRVTTNIIPTISDSLMLVIRYRRQFYSDYLVVAKITFESSDTDKLRHEQIEWMANIEIGRSNFQSTFDKQLSEAIEKGFDVVFKYGSENELISTTLKKIELILSPRFYATKMDMLRV
jgi:hypothetical protein